MKSHIYWIHALSPIHIGAGDSVAVIDLPIVRETVTKWPYLPASGIKGVCRDAARAASIHKDTIKAAFGPETIRGDDGTLDNAGGLWFSDARLLFFPVRSLYGTFAWVTCPLALSRFSRDAAHFGASPLPSVIFTVADDHAIVSPGSLVAHGGSVILEDLDLIAQETPQLKTMATAVAGSVFADPDWQSEFERRVVVVSDNVFTFLTLTATEITAHNRIEDATKRVQKGALWFEEAVPAESIFTMPVVAAGGADLLGALAPIVAAPIQIGGKASVGRGIVRMRVAEQEAAK